MNNISIKSVKFSGPATIVFFEDGTKAVTKCRAGDEYNAVLGVSWGICKKIARDMGATVKDLITAVVPQESYRTMPTFTTHVSVRTIAQLFCDERIDCLVDDSYIEQHDAAESVAFKQAFDESLWPETAFAGVHNVQASINNYIRYNGLSDIIRVYRDNGYICIARINK